MTEPSHGVTVTLREFLESRMDSLQREIGEMKVTLSDKFASINEIRGMASDMARLMMPRLEAENRLNALSEKADAIERRISEKLDIQSKAQASFNTQAASRMDVSQGRGAGLGAFWGYIVGAVGLLAAIAAIVASFITRHGP